MSYTKIINKKTLIHYHKPGNEHTTPYKGSYYEIGESQWWKGISVKYDSINDDFIEWGYINLTKPGGFDFWDNRTTTVDFDQTDWKKRKIIRGINIKFDDGKSDTLYTRFNHSKYFHLIVLKKSIEDFVGDTSKHYFDIIQSKNRFFPVLEKEYWSDNQISPFYFDIKPYNPVTYVQPNILKRTTLYPFWKDANEYIIEEGYSNWINEENWSVDNINFNLKWDEDIYLLFKHDFHPKWAQYHLEVNGPDHYRGEFYLPYADLNTTIKYELI